MKKVLPIVACVLAICSLRAGGTVIGADRLLGTVMPGTPSSIENELAMVNGLLEGWGGVAGYNDGAASGTVMGDNPYDMSVEQYTLKYSSGTLIPKPVPLATLPGYRKDTDNATVDLGAFIYDWVLAKWGEDAAVYYIGDLKGSITLSLDGTGWASTGHGLSHYTLFNAVRIPPDGGGGETPVPDGGTTVVLMGIGVLGIGFLRRYVS